MRSGLDPDGSIRIKVYLGYVRLGECNHRGQTKHEFYNFFVKFSNLGLMGIGAIANLGHLLMLGQTIK